MTTLTDAVARDRISTDTRSTLFVEAGAGSGKTKSLVDRVVTLVLTDRIPLERIAAVTFTEKAGAELRDRLRAAFDRALRPAGPAKVDIPAEHTELVEQALDAIDTATIGTLHSFAQRILALHPIEAGLPPLIEVLDEVASSVAFDERWSVLQRELLDDPALADSVLLALSAGVSFDHLRSLARAFGSDWDLIQDRVIPAPPPRLTLPDVEPLITRAGELAARATECQSDQDLFLERLTNLGAWVDVLRSATSAGETFAALVAAGSLKWGYGQKKNWSDLDGLKADCKQLQADAQALTNQLSEMILRPLAYWIAGKVLESAHLRAAEGRLEFHDLLVLARKLLRDDPEVRASLHDRFHTLLLDEFQDTDPIQIELAVRIAGGRDATAAHWQDIEVPPGSLFLVGDPKQSIYRFRRADISLFLEVQERLGATEKLTTNFRTVAPILTWTNEVFSQVIQPAERAQPAYEPLSPHRDGCGSGPAVQVIGRSEHQDKPNASQLREREAADVAAVIREALEQGWTVQDDTLDGSDAGLSSDSDMGANTGFDTGFDTGSGPSASPDSGTGSGPSANSGSDGAASGGTVSDTAVSRTAVSGGNTWRRVRLSDIAILLPARTSLPFLEEALDTAGIAYRAESSSLVYQAAEVRDLMAAARAISDPTDLLSTVTALRSPLFGCGDDDLWVWKHAGGSFNLLAPPADDALSATSVGRGLGYLQALHRRARWMTPSEVLASIVEDRRMLEVAADGPRARDQWRRLRFVLDQARAWSDTEHGGLRAYLAWAGRQAHDGSRVAEAVLPETDLDAVRIMTIHAAKGLEFPVVVMSGMSSAQQNLGGVRLLWPAGGGYSVRLNKTVQTNDFEANQPIDEQMDAYERRRLLYVAATRARDHLVVSLHRTGNSRTNAKLLDEAGAATAGGAIAFESTSADYLDIRAANSVTPPPPWDEWHSRLQSVREAAGEPSSVSASGLEGTDPEVVFGLLGTTADAEITENATVVSLSADEPPALFAIAEAGEPGSRVLDSRSPGAVSALGEVDDVGDVGDPDSRSSGEFSYPDSLPGSSVDSAADPRTADPEAAVDAGSRPPAGAAKGPRDVELPPWSKGRDGTAVGRAVHGVLQTIDLATGTGLDQAVAAQCAAEGVSEYSDVVHGYVRSALDADVVRRAVSRQYWRESFVGTVMNDGRILEGVIDLMYREDDGTVVVIDYKTDDIPPAAIPVRTEYYRPQLEAYLRGVGAALAGGPDTKSGKVSKPSGVLLFLNPKEPARSVVLT